MPKMEVDPVAAPQVNEAADNGHEPKRSLEGSESKEEEPTLAAWRWWVHGPYVAFRANDKMADQIAEGTIKLMEDMAIGDVPEGAEPALAARAGVKAHHQHITAAPAVYRERRRLPPDFVKGIFVPFTKGE